MFQCLRMCIGFLQRGLFVCIFWVVFYAPDPMSPSAPKYILYELACDKDTLDRMLEDRDRRSGTPF